MFLHVKGEGLNVGCNLTWGPCYDFQRQFFEPTPHKLSEPFTRAQVRHRGQRLRLAGAGPRLPAQPPDQTYPGSDGTKTKGWPTWTTPLMRWAKQQGAYTGYAHSANGLIIDPAAGRPSAAGRSSIPNKDGKSLSAEEADKGLLPEDFDEHRRQQRQGPVSWKELTPRASRRVAQTGCPT